MPNRKTLQNITGNAPLNLLSCRECESKKKANESVPYDYKNVQGFKWALEICCPDDSHSSFISVQYVTNKEEECQKKSVDTS